MHRHRTVRSGALALLLMTGAAACRDNPVDPSTEEVRLELWRSGAPFEEETIEVGATLQIAANLIDSSGESRSASNVTWESTDDGVATVDANGRVTAVSIGSTKIVGRAGERADTGLVNVRTTVTGLPECSAGDVLSLNLGQARTFSGDEAMDLCLGAGSSTQEYLVVPVNESVAADARLAVRVIAGSVPSPSTSLMADRVAAGATSLRPGPRRDDLFHELHLQRSRSDFEPALRTALSTPQITARAVPSVGTLLQLNAGSLAGQGCDAPDYRTGRVMAVSTRAVIVADTMNPAGGFTTADYETIAETFDDLIWRVTTENFGEPSDIDENQRVLIFYTRAVNELTPRGADSYVGGFFYNRDLFPRQGTARCDGSNEAEMFYMLVPDPEGRVNGNVRGRDFVFDRTFSVLAHEFQHLINDSRRLYVNDAPTWEVSWLNEGLSHIAEELAFFEASGYSTGQNTGSSAVSGAAGQHFFRYNIDNFERLLRFLRAPEEHSPLGDVVELGTRGSSWAFLRYVADREPGDDQAMWRRLVNSRTAGLQNLEEVLGADPRAWLRDWQVSVFTDDFGAPVNEVHTQPTWNYRVLFQLLDPSGQYPLRTRSVSPTSSAVVLQGGGATFIRMPVAASTRRAVRTTVNDLPPPSRLKLVVVRIR